VVKSECRPDQFPGRDEPQVRTTTTRMSTVWWWWSYGESSGSPTTTSTSKAPSTGVSPPDWHGRDEHKQGRCACGIVANFYQLLVNSISCPRVCRVRSPYLFVESLDISDSKMSAKWTWYFIPIASNILYTRWDRYGRDGIGNEYQFHITGNYRPRTDA
jgi:hypothetical protein